MNIFVVDISGKVVNYDIALCEALTKDACDELMITFFSPLYNEHPQCATIRLIKLVPQKYKASLSLWKRTVKIIELMLNYFCLFLHVLFKKPDLIHFQWFPFLEKSCLECIIVKMIKIASSRAKIVLTIHNVYPHDISQHEKVKYRTRFLKMDRDIDNYIVHTISTRNEVVKEYNVLLDKLEVIPHGIFKPNYAINSCPSKRGNSIVMFGYNDQYKGADILIEALKYLPENISAALNVTIAGRTSDDYLEQLQSKASGLNVTFIPSFIPDQELYKIIDESDYLALPYRRISQSGVLLLSLYFKKPLLISNLPSFVETLVGFTPDMFFESENPHSLAQLITRFVEGKIDVSKEIETIERLNHIYSWDNVAQKTITLYQCIVK